jgi:2,4-dienoyl-CoA reductase-like NADH-dependent reductase (Old Yellow Enzyme family)/thioredoxin reductase
MNYSALFKPFKIRNLEIPNRIIMAAMGNNLSGTQGVIGPLSLAYYRERARGGVGMITTEAVAVSLTGRHRAGGLCLFEEDHENGMAELVKVLHKEGAKVSVQLNHGGRLCDPKVNGGCVVAPSEIGAGAYGVVPHSMTIEEIQDTVADFAQAAGRAVKAGFDAIEIHGAHGYLVHEFFSPRANQRNDDYGGNLENRMRFPLEIVTAVRETVGPNPPLTFRINAEEYEEGGAPIEEALAYGQALKDAGVDILHVSAGTTERAQSSTYCIQPQALPEGCLIPFAERFRRELGPPVIGVGRIVTPAFADQIIREEKVDLVAMGRSLLADPAWPNKAAGKMSGAIRPCIACNNCLESISHQKPVNCAVNPLTGHEDELPIKRASKPKTIAVVGAGPAGMEAAGAAALLGHRVLLYERQDRIGGQLWEAAIPPHKSRLKNVIRFHESRLAETGVEVHLQEDVTGTTLKEKDVDVVVVATGSGPAKPAIPGVDQPQVVMSRDALKNPTALGKTILVVGGGSAGCETSEFLAEQGREVRLIEMLDDVAGDVEPRTRLLLLERLNRLDVEITTGCRLLSINAGYAVVDLRGHEEKISADSIVLALGAKPNDELALSLQGGDWEFYAIGDCRTPGDIKDAVHQGYRVVRENL